MDAEKYKNYLLSTMPLAKVASGGKEIICRCVYCGDSARNPNSRHMYISIPQDDTQLSFFHCKRAVCGAGGVVNNKTLLEWGAYDPEISTEIIQHNNTAMANPENRKFKASNIYKIYNDVITEDNLSSYKLSYINNRLGASLTYEDVKNLKIVLNLSDLIKRNDLKCTRDSRIIDALDSGFIGFLSYDNAFLNMRDIGTLKDKHPSIEAKYINYNIFNSVDNTKRFYTIPSSINLLNPNPIQLHVAEGAFDILGIYLNVRNRMNNSIFTSVGGSGYIGVIKFFILELKLPNIELHVYPDNDITPYQLIPIANLARQFNHRLFIHRNACEGEKDFGVPSDRIQEIIEQLV